MLLQTLVVVSAPLTPFWLVPLSYVISVNFFFGNEATPHIHARHTLTLTLILILTLTLTLILTLTLAQEMDSAAGWITAYDTYDVIVAVPIYGRGAFTVILHHALQLFVFYSYMSDPYGVVFMIGGMCVCVCVLLSDVFFVWHVISLNVFYSVCFQQLPQQQTKVASCLLAVVFCTFNVF